MLRSHGWVQAARSSWAMILSGLLGVDPDRTERELARRAREGDASAFREIFDRCGPAVRRFSRDLMRDPALADEVTQETFVRALDRLGRLKQDERLLAWLLGIARLVCAEQFRLRRRSQDRHCEDSDEGDRVPAGFTPESRALAREAAGVVQAGLESLSVDRQTALLLRFDHGLAYQEIAELMGWSLAKAKVEIHRARVLLRDRMDRYEQGES
ncbi:MAG: RNA polymerase sigma factor [Myxococcota bacterium]|nr:RNA polymerase sigma factor [Myxococcota bacterium]